MRNAWVIAFNDIRMFLKDKTGYVWLFVMPLVFTYFFGIAMRADRDEPVNPRPSVLIENDDRGYLGELLMQEMDAQGMRLIEAGSDTTPSRGIRIPVDFTKRVEAQEEVKITFFKVDHSSAEPAAMIELRLLRAIIGLTSGLFSLATDDDQQLTEENLKEALQRDKNVRLSVAFAGNRPVPSGFEQSVPGYMVMFTLMNLVMFGGISIAQERSGGVLRRIAVHPIAKWELVVGKIFGRFLLGLVQVVFFMLAGWLLFGVDYSGNFVLVALTMTIFAWLCASLGVFIGALWRRSDHIEGVCVLVSIGMAALGGCWWPMEVVPDHLKTVGHAFPTAWAMDAMHQLISFGGGFAQIRFELFVLTGFAVTFTALASRFLRFV